MQLVIASRDTKQCKTCRAVFPAPCLEQRDVDPQPNPTDGGSGGRQPPLMDPLPCRSPSSLMTVVAPYPTTDGRFLPIHSMHLVAMVWEP